MAFCSSVRRRISGVLLIAFLFSSLVPAFGWAQGGGMSAQAVWAQLCSADGPLLVALDDIHGDASHDAQGSSHAGHCLLCFHPSTTPRSGIPTPVAVAAPALRVATPEEPLLWVPGAWPDALARAPPILS